jgi:hypothetical protein
MKFTVKSRPPDKSDNINGRAFLVEDNWDDWGKYRTQFFLFVSDQSGELHGIGSLKIGQFGLLPSQIIKEGNRAPSLGQEFNALDERFDTFLSP